MKTSEHKHTEIAKEQLTNEEQISLINIFVRNLGQVYGLDRKTFFNYLSKKRPLVFSKTELDKKNIEEYERVHKQVKYLYDLIRNNDLLDVVDREIISKREWYINNPVFTPTITFLLKCRNHYKKVCKKYGIEYDLIQFKKSINENSFETNLDEKALSIKLSKAVGFECKSTEMEGK